MGEDNLKKDLGVYSKSVDESINSRELWWAVVRLVLGILQIMGSTLSLLLLIQAGVSTATIVACVITTFFTVISRLLFSTAREK
jgi:hypothetical protein